MTYSIAAYYKSSGPTVITGPDQVDDFITELLAAGYGHSIAKLHVRERPPNAAGFPDHMLRVAVNADDNVGGLAYLGPTFAGFSKGQHSWCDEVVYSYAGHDHEFPRDSEISLVGSPLAAVRGEPSSVSLPWRDPENGIKAAFEQVVIVPASSIEMAGGVESRVGSWVRRDVLPGLCLRVRVRGLAPGGFRKRSSDHVVGQHSGDHGQPVVRKAAAQQRRLEALGACENVRSEHWPPDQAWSPGVTEHGRAPVADQISGVMSPVIGGLRKRHVAEDAVEGQVEDVLLGFHVPVQRGGGDVEKLGEAAHRQAVDTVLVK